MLNFVKGIAFAAAILILILAIIFLVCGSSSLMTRTAPKNMVKIVSPDIYEKPLKSCFYSPVDDFLETLLDSPQEPEDYSIGLTGKDLYIYYIFDITGEYYPDLDPWVIQAQVQVESNWNPNALGSSDDRGLMQIIPKWNQDRMDRLGVTDLYSPYDNLRVGIDLMNEYYQKYGNYELALMAYNMGPVNAEKMYRSGTVSDYAIKILSLAEDIMWSDLNA